jgi:hypothetical protein
VLVDAPFAGALVPLVSFRKDRRVLSVMIEVNRRLYMVLIGMGSRRRSASQAIDLPSDGGVNFERLFTGEQLTLCLARAYIPHLISQPTAVP